MVRKFAENKNHNYIWILIDLSFWSFQFKNSVQCIIFKTIKDVDLCCTSQKPFKMYETYSWNFVLIHSFIRWCGEKKNYNPTFSFDRMVPFCTIDPFPIIWTPGRVAQSAGHLTRKSGILGSIPGLATYFRFSFRFIKKGSCQLLAKVCARSTWLTA